MLGKLLEFFRPQEAQTERPTVRSPLERPDVAALRRTAWIPLCEDGPGRVAQSRFSGIGLLRRDETWPECGNCGKPMQLFLQLSSDELPTDAEAPFGDGYLQMFYCTNSEPLCEVDCEGWEPFSSAKLLRVLPSGKDYKKIAASPVEDAFPSKVITGWKAVDDYPNWEELHSMSVALSDAELDLLGEEYPQSGEKLLGWPYWVQGVEYPSCPTCGQQMRLLFQIDSESNLPYMFGDVGVGHITQCPEHLDVLGFGWACH